VEDYDISNISPSAQGEETVAFQTLLSGKIAAISFRIKNYVGLMRTTRHY
jgi:hypothetical protein